jgi:hypothetical protein
VEFISQGLDLRAPVREKAQPGLDFATSDLEITETQGATTL